MNIEFIGGIKDGEVFAFVEPMPIVSVYTIEPAPSMSTKIHRYKLIQKQDKYYYQYTSTDIDNSYFFQNNTNII